MQNMSQGEWLALSDLLDQAFELTDADRGPWLSRLRERDPATAERVARALAASGEDGFADFLTGSSAPLISEVATATLSGRRVGPYVIEAEIGRGGMGSVWRARRVDGRYDGIVAVKFVHAAWIGRDGEQRFRTEGTLLGRLHHPHIARLLDAGMLDDTQPYLILEHVEGEPIDVYCARHRLSLVARLRLFIDVLAAVAHAHSYLVVHRDLKPSNIFVTREGTVKLLDFGIAKLLDPGAESSPQTRSTAAALTPAYAAPEQLLGLGVTTATDVYAIGLVLYLLLTGSHPLRSDTRSNAELLHAVLNEPPQPASQVARVTTITRRTLAGDLDNILNKALKKEPAERYSTIGSLADDLQRFLSHQPIQARADTVSYRVTKFVRRHRGGVTVGILTLMAILAGVIGTVTQAQRAEQQAARAQHERDNALRELSYAEAANEFVNFLLGEGAGKPFTTVELLARADQLAEKQFGHDADLRARLQLMIGGAYALAADMTQARATLGRAHASVNAVNDVAVSALIDCTTADLDLDSGDMNSAKTLFTNAIERLRGAAERDHAALARCLTMRGEMEAIQGDGPAALASGQEALRWLGNPRPGQRTLAVDAHTTVAEGYGRIGELSKSIAEYETAMHEVAAMGREHTAGAAVTMNNLAEKYSRAGQFVQAAASYRRALEIATDAEGEANVSPLAEANYATSLFDNGRTEESSQHFEHAYANSRRLDQKLWAAYIQVMAAPSLCEAAELARCARWIDESGVALRSLLPAGHPTFGILDLDAARLSMAKGAPAEARAHLQRALSTLVATSEPRPSVVIALTLLARCEQLLGNDAAAMSAADRAVSAAEALRTGFVHTAWIGSALLAQGVVLDAQGNAAAARAVLLRAQAHLDDAAGPDAAATRETHALLARIDASAQP